MSAHTDKKAGEPTVGYYIVKFYNHKREYLMFYDGKNFIGTKGINYPNDEIESYKYVGANPVALPPVQEGVEGMTDEWISVNDSLPELFNSVLLIAGGHYSRPMSTGTLTDNGFEIDRKDMRNNKITHWMNLPPYPKN